MQFINFLMSRIDQGFQFYSCLFLNLALFSFQDAVFVVSLSRSFRFSLAASYSLYHILGSLSSLFSKFFEKLFVFLLMRFLESLALCNLSIRSQAFLLYHILRCLSRGFSNFFEIFSCLTQWFFSSSTSSELPFGLAANLFIIPLFRKFVKCFFKISFGFFLGNFDSLSRLLSQNSSLRLFTFPKMQCLPGVSFLTLALQLLYYSTNSDICQAKESM